MQLVAQSGVWVATSSYEERAMPKAAGFWWHPGSPCGRRGCRACAAGVGKTWWTADRTVAARLAAHAADDATRASVAAVEEAKAASLAADAAVDVPAPVGCVYLPFQRAGIAYALARSRAIIGDEMGLGKGQPADAMVMSPGGWRRIGELLVGDQITGSSGAAVTVIGVYPRGRLAVYRVRFSDDTSLTVDADHLWTVTTANDRFRESRQIRVVSTVKLAELLTVVVRRAYAIPQVAPVEHPERALPVDPYVLGVLLGDGHLATAGHAAQFTPGDEDVPASVAERLPPGVYLREIVTTKPARWSIVTEPRSAANPVLDGMRALGLDGIEASERFVPLDYLLGSVEQRCALLRGLMDTDGELTADGHVAFSSASLKLADAVAEVVESLGGTVRRHVRARTGYRDDNDRFSPFLARCGYVDRQKYPPLRVVRSVEPAGEADVVCIAVDAPDQLYVTEHHIVTHNTVEALGVVNADPAMRRVLVVCPATLRLNWRREAEKWLVRPRPCVIVAEDDPAIPAGDVLVVVNYERVRRPACLVALRAAGPWDLVVVDEAHRLKDEKTAQTRAVLGERARKAGDADKPGLVDGAGRVLLLSGTPIVNRPIELWPLAHCAAPDMFDSFWVYAKRYANAHKEWVGGRFAKEVWNLQGSSHLDELQDKLRASCMVRRLKADVLPELPPKRRQVIDLAQNGCARVVAAEQAAWARHQDALDAAQEAVDAADAMGDADAYKQAVAALRGVGRVAFEEMAKVRHDTAVAKVPAVAEHVLELLEAEDAVLVFGHHHDVLDGLRAALGEAGIRTCGIDGRTQQGDRQAVCDAFQAQGGPRVFIGGITAAGVGLTLTRARVVVFAELDWVPGNVTQAEDRAHRIGQTDAVLVQHLVLDGSLDSRMARVLVEKQDVADQALDRARQPVVASEPVVPTGRQARPARYPEATPEQRRVARAAVEQLAGACDGARRLDGAGFSKVDAAAGHSLAAALTDYTDGQVWLAMKLARKYRRQLPADLAASVEGYHAQTAV